MQHTHDTQGAHHHGACSSCCGSGVSIAASGSGHASEWWANRELQRLALALTLALLEEITELVRPDYTGWSIAGMGLAVLAIALAGTAVFRQGGSALMHGNLNINALMTVAVTGAFLIGGWTEGALVMGLYSLGEYIEHRSGECGRYAI